MLWGKNGRGDDIVVRGARVLDPAEGIDALRRGGHPNAAGLQRLPGGRF